MDKQAQLNHFQEQLLKGLLIASENMLAFKRYKKTPVIIVRDGQVVEVSPDELPPMEQKAA